MSFNEIPEEWRSKSIKHYIEQAVEIAKDAGYVITVTQQPLEPLAMGSYKSVVDVRKARHPATNTHTSDEGEFDRVVNSAFPSKAFNIPPFRAELFNDKTGWAGVMNQNGVNALCIPKYGCTTPFTDIQTAEAIAKKWNNEAKS